MIALMQEPMSSMSSSEDKKSANGHTAVRKATPSDAEDFAELILLSSPSLFPAIYGDEVKAIMERLYRQPGNLFSFEHTCFAERAGRKAGMMLAYDWRARQRYDWRTGWLLLRAMKMALLGKLPLMMKTERVTGKVDDGEYYISNIATYAACRATGVGTSLICEAERQAKANGAARIALDVEADNSGAIRLYHKLGFSTVSESTLRLGRGRRLRFYRMRKEL